VNPYQWPDGTPKSQYNAFNWRVGAPSFLAELHHAKRSSAVSTKNLEQGITKTITIKKGKS